MESVLTSSPLGLPTPSIYEDTEFSLFENSVSKFLDAHATPSEVQTWRDNGIVPRDIWNKAGAAGLLALSTSAEYGGMGGDFRHEVILMEQLGRRGIEGWDITLHNAIVAPYIEAYGTDEQKRKWLPGIATGEIVTAIAMTEPGTGSDLQAVRTSALRTGDTYVVNGSKTFITNGQSADLIAVVAKTDPAIGARGISLIMVETAKAAGFERGRNLDKIGRDASDTSELFFTDMQVPVANLLGGVEGRGFVQLMEKLPQERLILAAQAAAAIEYILSITLDYVKERKAFGQVIIDFQNTQFKLAECQTNATIAKVFMNYCTEQLLGGTLDAATASMAKYWLTETQGKVIDECLQLHGGYGYMNEYPIANMFRDARGYRIYGGTSEIMKLIISRSL